VRRPEFRQRAVAMHRGAEAVEEDDARQSTPVAGAEILTCRSVPRPGAGSVTGFTETMGWAWLSLASIVVMEMHPPVWHDETVRCTAYMCGDNTGHCPACANDLEERAMSHGG